MRTEIYTSNTDSYKTIDGNYAKAVRAYCTRYRGYVTFKQMRTHGCLRKHGGACSRLQDMKGENIKRMTQTQYQDKMIDRLDKMITAMNRISKAIDRFSRLMDEMEEKLAEMEEMESEQVGENE